MTAHIGTFVADTAEVNGRTFELVVDETDRTSAWQCLTCRTYVGPSSDGMADHDCPVCAMCNDEREIELRHPNYGNINCPEPTITVACPDCGGATS